MSATSPDPGSVTYSSSTWQQPVPQAASAERRALVHEVATIIARRAATDGGRTRVVIDGRTAAGKTSFGHELAEALAGRGRAVFRASLDDFKRPWNEAHLYDRTSGEGYYRNAQDVDAIRRLLLDPCGSDGDGVVALCSIDPLTQRSHDADAVQVPAGGVLIVDGVFALRPGLDDAWDLHIWLDVGQDVSIARGAARDAELEGSADAAEELHRDRYGVAEAIYIREVDPIGRADVVIDNEHVAVPRIVRRP